MGAGQNNMAAISSGKSNTLAIFVEGHLVTISAKLFSILAIGFREYF